MIYKKGDKLNPNNYRPIALLSTLLKLFTQVLHERLNEWATMANILPEAQGGFRKNRGCDDQIFVLNTAITLGTRHKGKVYACFFDFARAFPSCPHDKLWHKLNSIGVSTKFIRILRKIYEKSSTEVRLQDNYTDPIPITEGLAQGCILSPLLFSLYTCDIEEVLKDLQAGGIQISRDLLLHILLYADDMIIMSPTPEGLKMKIRCLQKYLYTYLGVPLSSSGLYSVAAKHFKQKGLTALGATWNILTKARLESLDKKHTLFQALVTSTALYGAHIWSLRYTDEPEKIQYQYHRRLLGLPHGTPGYALRLELNRPPLLLPIVKQTIRFWWKISFQEDDRYTKKCLHALQRVTEGGDINLTYNWLQQFHDILNKYAPSLDTHNMDRLSLIQAGPGIYDAITLKQREADIRRVAASARFNHYSQIIPAFQHTATYISLPLPLSVLRLIAQCRLGQGSFRTPIGYIKLKYEEVCNICNKQENQTLWHVCCSCPLNVEARSAFFRNKIIPTEDDFYPWLNPNTKPECLKLARFINTCLMQVQELPSVY